MYIYIYRANPSCGFHTQATIVRELYNPQYQHVSDPTEIVSVYIDINR